MKKELFLLILSIFFFKNIYAENITESKTSNIRKALSQYLPELKVDQINTSRIPEVYEVIAGRKVFYVDSTGRYAMLGNLLDLTSKENLTQKKVESLNVINWSQLPLNIALKEKIGNGTRKLAVFTDPDCQFCKRFEGEVVPKLKDVTIYYFLYPLPIHVNAETNSKRILCSPNPEKSFREWMVNEKKLPLPNQCKRADTLQQMVKVAKDIVMVDVTPTLILPDGRVINGLVPADYINKLLTDASPAIASNKGISLESSQP